MKRILVIFTVLAYAVMAGGCATAWKNVAYTDDLYSIHNKIAIANRQKAEAELAKAQYEAEQAQYEAALARVKAEAAKQGVTVTDDTAFNGYDAVLADTYESAYARRLYGFSSPTYRMPSSYYSWRYSDAFHYASAYDPAFYNIMVSGDMVWVEPKYITSMFGSWGAAPIPSYGWYYGWNDPYYYWNNPYRYGWNWSWSSYWGWNSSFYWGWGYPYPYPPYHHHHHHHHNPPHHNYPPHHGGVGNTGHHHNRPGAVVGRNPGASRPADRATSVGGSSRPSGVRTSQPVYRQRVQSSSPSYRSGSSSGRSSGSSTYRGNSTSSSSSYRSPSSGVSSGGGSSYYSSPSSSSSGGNARGR